MAVLLTFSACGGGGDQESGAAGSTTTAPPEGVPATYDGPPHETIPGQAYNNPQPRDNIEDGGTLALSISNPGPNFNWWSSAGSTAANSVLLGVFTPAFNMWNYTVDGDPTPNPDYLTSVKLVKENPETVEYVINEKATWNNGDPITWRAFHATWTTQRGDSDKYTPSNSAGYSSIKNVEQGKDPKHVIVTFSESYYPYQSVFTTLEHPKNLDPEFYMTGWVNDLHPELGAGPFTVDSLTKTEIVFKRNPNWWGEPAKLDKLIYRVMDASSINNAFANGEIGAMGVGGPEDLETIKVMEDVTIRTGPNPHVDLLSLNKDAKFFQDQDMRLAVIYGTNRKLLGEIESQGLNWEEEPPGSLVVFPFVKGYEDNMKDLNYDVERAKKLLDDAGWAVGSDGIRSKDGAQATFTYMNFGNATSTTARGRAMQQMMEEIGISVEIVNKPQAQFGTELDEKKWDMIDTGFTFSSSPFAFAEYGSALLSSDGGLNSSGVGSDEIDAMVAEMTTESDVEEAKKLYNKAERAYLGLGGAIPFYNGPDIAATKAKLANYGPAGFLSVPWADVGWQK
ncbi:MAG: ABC transporter family substrate-binding protein [Propionibacteriaceae bacterium]